MRASIRKSVMGLMFLSILLFGITIVTGVAWADDLTVVDKPLRVQEDLQDGSSFFNKIESGTATFDADTGTIMCNDVVADWMRVNDDITIKGEADFIRVSPVVDEHIRLCNRLFWESDNTGCKCRYPCVGQ